MSAPYQAQTGEGQSLDPRAGSIPILKEVSPGRLAVIGTGAYITRYGFFITAKHVLEELVDASGAALAASYVMHFPDERQIHLRQIIRAFLLRAADVAIGYADNYETKYPNAPLMNLRYSLTLDVPRAGSRLVTYVYPENRVLNFDPNGEPPTLSSDFYEGDFLRHVEDSDNPWLPYPHFETSIAIRSGASGGPVFDERGRIVGIASRGWDFRGAEHEGNELSSIIPVASLLSCEVDQVGCPKLSWEYQQIPVHLRGRSLSVEHLGQMGHVLFNPLLKGSEGAV